MAQVIVYENGNAIGGEGHPTDADDITFDNTGTDLVSEDVESAIKEVNANSAKSADLTSISESGATASQAISAGTYFYLNGTLVRAKTNIASGATFTLNTNYEVVTAGALNKLSLKYDTVSGTTNAQGLLQTSINISERIIVFSKYYAQLCLPLEYTGSTYMFAIYGISGSSVVPKANASVTVDYWYYEV